jgi:alanine racemase
VHREPANPGAEAGASARPRPDLPRRPAWVEIDLEQLRRNFSLIHRDRPSALRVLSVVKDEAYGHGSLAVAKVALESGVAMLGVITLQEGMTLRDHGVRAPILLLGERRPEELPWCVEHDLACCVNDRHTALELARVARQRGKPAAVHVKIDTGLSRYGVRWTEAAPLCELIAQTQPLVFEGVMSHFAMSDELDKSFALVQLERFREALGQIAARGVAVRYRHLCNSGGFLDLPQAQFDLVRIGILPLGVYPSTVCRRLPGLAPVMSVKAKVASVRNLQPGDTVGYGMRYRAESPRRIAVLPIGYADGYPRLRNLGWVLLHGRRAPVVGGTAMDATMVDITDIPAAGPGDEAVLLGPQGEEEITARDVAQWKGTVTYDVLCGWRSRLPRVYVGSQP